VSQCGMGRNCRQSHRMRKCLELHRSASCPKSASRQEDRPNQALHGRATNRAPLSLCVRRLRRKALKRSVSFSSHRSWVPPALRGRTPGCAVAK